MPKQRDRSIHPLFPVKGQRRYGGCRQLHTGQQNDTGHRLASIPPLPTFGILSRCPRLHTHFKRSNIPEQETDIPTRKHSLLAGNQGCVLDPTSVTVPVRPQFLHFTLYVEYQQFIGAVFSQGVYKTKICQNTAYHTVSSMKYHLTADSCPDC